MTRQEKAIKVQELLDEVNVIVGELEKDNCRIQYEVVEGKLVVHIEKFTVLA